LIPQPGSLGIEMIIYVIFPFMLLSRVLFTGFVVMSFFVLFAAFTSFISSAAYAYYSFPGTLAYFILGNYLYEQDRRAICMTMLAFLLIFTVSTLSGNVRAGFNTEIVLGVAFGFIILSTLKSLPSNALGRNLGDASCGAFLSHFVAIQSFRHYSVLSASPVLFAVAVLACSFITGWASFWIIGRPTISLRRRLKSGGKPRPLIMSDTRGKADEYILRQQAGRI
jgi:peptidoglycan/LPS O-acetylase OafA/YrhL